MFNLLWRTKKSASHFEKCNDGAVTVDWVVLSATIVVFGAIMIGIYKEGVFDLSTAIQESVTAGAPDPSQW